MRRSVVIYLALATVIATALVALSGCRSAAAPDGRLSVVTTIYPVTYFAQRIGGGRVQVTSLAPPGVEAHDYEPKPSDLRAVLGADLVVFTHPSFEVWMADALKSRPAGKAVVQAVEGVRVSGADPHVWLDPAQAAAMATRIRDGLVQTDPEGRAVYEANTAVLAVELEAFDSRITAALSNCKLKAVVVSHTAYGHLLQGYGVEQIGLAGLQAEPGEVGPRTVAEVTDRMKAEGIKHVLVEPILSSELAKRVAEDTGSTLLPLHPLESLTRAEAAAGDTYFTVMERNVQSLRTALGCA
jgi:zinc transport system substrate-binding protein